jgi:glycine cleavage system H lipoate-binding protein
MKMGNIEIYATKGLEYLWILSFLAIFTGFYLYFTSKRFQPPLVNTAAKLGSLVEWFRVPENIYFHQGHSWIRPEEDDPATVRVGIDDFAQKMVGKVDSVNMVEVGKRLTQGKTAWRLAVGDKYVPMLSPVSGVVVGVNKAFQNGDPFGGGWIYKVKPDNIRLDKKNLLSGRLAVKWMEVAAENLRQRMSPDLGAVYQDGGMPIEGMARNIDIANWDKLLAEFFLT